MPLLNVFRLDGVVLKYSVQVISRLPSPHAAQSQVIVKAKKVVRNFPLVTFNMG